MSENLRLYFFFQWKLYNSFGFLENDLPMPKHSGSKGIILAKGLCYYVIKVFYYIIKVFYKDLFIIELTLKFKTAYQTFMFYN